MAEAGQPAARERDTASDNAGNSAGTVRDACPADTLFYDGQCPLCAAEIEALADARGASLRLVDIHQLGTADGLEQTDPAGGRPERVEGRSSTGTESGRGRTMADAGQAPGVDDLLRTLHLRRADGTWLTGADANVAAWEETRRGRLLRVLRWPVLRPFVDLAYRIWASWRYRRLYGRQFDTERHAPRPPGH